MIFKTHIVVDLHGKGKPKKEFPKCLVSVVLESQELAVLENSESELHPRPTEPQQCFPGSSNNFCIRKFEIYGMD